VIPGGKTTLPGESSLRDTIRSMTMPQHTGGAQPVSLSMGDITACRQSTRTRSRAKSRAPCRTPVRDLLTQIEAARAQETRTRLRLRVHRP
jgi:hypothetical protein